MITEVIWDFIWEAGFHVLLTAVIICDLLIIKWVVLLLRWCHPLTGQRGPYRRFWNSFQILNPGWGLTVELCECLVTVGHFGIYQAYQVNYTCILIDVCFSQAGPSSRAVWGVGLRPLACWDRGFESHRQHGCLSVVSVVCCQVEVSATSWSLVQRSPTDCGASLNVI